MKGRVLVTGGAGFIGSFMTEQLLEAGYEVRVFDNLTPQVHLGSKRPSYLVDECELVVGDVRDGEALQKALEGVSAVVHLAARVGVGQSQYEIRSYTDVNIGGTATLLDLWANQYRDKIRKLVIASSMSIYGEGSYRCPGCAVDSFTERTETQLNSHKWEPQCLKCGKELIPIPTPEDRPLKGPSVYALSKRVQEELALSVCKTYQLPVTAFRFFNVFGPRQSLSNPYTGVLSIFLSRIKNNHSPILYEDGYQTRDFISVHDIARACLIALEDSQVSQEVYNLGTGQANSIRQIAEFLISELGSSISLDVTQRFRKGDIRHCYADITQLSSRYTLTPGLPFEDRIRELIEWAQAEEAIDYSDKAQKELTVRGLI